MSDTVFPVDDPKDFGPGLAGVGERWQAELKAYEHSHKEWLLTCRDIQRRYREDDPIRADDQAVIGSSRFNVLWSNIQTLVPALYSRAPIPVVTRRFRDRDPVARVASTVLQRALSYTIEASDMDDRIRHAVLDYALYARGTEWARYSPPSEDDQGRPVAEAVEWDYVHRDDFAHGPGKTWADVDWVSRTVRMTRAQGLERFGGKFRKVDLTWSPPGENRAEHDRDDEVINRAEIVEIWCKSERKVIFIGNPLQDPVVLEVTPDPLGLKDFFPCPAPLFGTMTTGTLVPVPDFKEYRDQARELDDLTGRIQALTSAIRMNFGYNARFPELSRIFDEGMENQGIAVEDWSAFATNNGMQGAFSFVPVDAMISTLQSLIEARQTVKADLYEITGIADIVRGSTAPEETATAQRIKGRYAGLRLSDRQFAVARFVRDMLRLTGEIIAEKFSPMTLWEVSNFPAMDHGNENPVVIFMQAVDLLRNEKMRGFQIDIEDQSTIALDDGEDKRDRMEFLAALGQFIGNAVQLPPAMAPALLPMLGKMVLFGARGFRIGAEMEVTIEDAMTGLAKQMEQQAQQPPQPTPEMIKAQADAQRMQLEGQIKQTQAQAALQIEGIKAQAIQMKSQSDQAIAGAQLQIKQLEAQMMGVRIDADARQAEAQNAQDTTDHLLRLQDADLSAVDQDHQHAIDWAKIGIEQQKVDIAEDAAEAKEDESEGEE